MAIETTGTVGQAYESKTLAYLLTLPTVYLLGRNIRYQRAELDFVWEESVHHRVELVFGEVRYRAKGGAIESVGARKQTRLLRGARLFLLRYEGKATQVRFDILGWEGQTLRHVKNAWHGVPTKGVPSRWGPRLENLGSLRPLDSSQADPFWFQ